MPRPTSALHRFNSARPVSVIEQLSKIDRAIKAPELARLLAVSPITVYKMSKAGRLPSFRIAGAVRFDPGSIVRWLNDGK